MVKKHNQNELPHVDRPGLLSEQIRCIKDAVVRSRNEEGQIHLIVEACSLAIGNGACSVWLARQDRSMLELAASYGYDHNYNETVRAGKTVLDLAKKIVAATNSKSEIVFAPI